MKEVSKMERLPTAILARLANEGGETKCLPILWQASEDFTHIEPGFQNDVYDYGVHTGKLISILPNSPLIANPVHGNPFLVSFLSAVREVLLDHGYQYIQISEAQFLVTSNTFTFQEFINQLGPNLSSKQLTIRPLDNVHNAYIICRYAPATSQIDRTALIRALLNRKSTKRLH